MPALQTLLSDVIRRKASDLHLSAGVPPVFRVDGEMTPMSNATPLVSEEIDSLLKGLLSADQYARFEENHELDFSFTFKNANGESARFRGNAFMERGNIGVALRMIPTTIRTIKTLLLPPILHEIAQKPRGLFLVTGPTGHGKSTTLAALIQEINQTRRSNIITIEDPIEYLFHSERSVISQREVGTDTKSFSEALKRVLRQDPDVIMIGEMRDLETIAAALTAAETGHLVFATLHTPDAPQTVDRIIDVFPPYQQQQVRLQLSNILIGICSQQLIPLDGGGRVVATEILIANAAVRNCIREGKITQIASLMQTSSECQMHTMDQDLARMVKMGVISYEVARQFVYNLKDMERLIFEERGALNPS